MASLREHSNHFHKVIEEAVHLKLTRDELCVCIWGVSRCKELIDDGKHPIFTAALEEAYNTLEAILDKHNDAANWKSISFNLKRGMLCNITRALLGYADAMWKAGKNGKVQDDLRAVWKKLHDQRAQHDVKAAEKGWRV